MADRKTLSQFAMALETSRSVWTARGLPPLSRACDKHADKLPSCTADALPLAHIPTFHSPPARSKAALKRPQSRRFAHFQNHRFARSVRVCAKVRVI